MAAAPRLMQSRWKLKGCEIAGAAVVSGIFACEDIEEGTKELLQKVNMVVKNHE